MCKGNLVLATLQMCLSHQNCRDFLQHIMLKMQKKTSQTPNRQNSGKVAQSHGGNDPISFIAGAPSTISTPLSQECRYPPFRKENSSIRWWQPTVAKAYDGKKMTIHSTRASCQQESQIFGDCSTTSPRRKWWNEFKKLRNPEKSRNETSWGLNQPIWKSNRIISPRDRARGEK